MLKVRLHPPPKVPPLLCHPSPATHGEGLVADFVVITVSSLVCTEDIANKRNDLKPLLP